MLVAGGRGRAPIGCAAALLLALGAAGCATPSRSGTPTDRLETDLSTKVGEIQLHALDRRFVPGGDLTSSNGQVLWSAGTHAAPELWRFVPGDAEPEQIFVSAHPDAVITDVVAADPGYAFVETSTSAYGDGGWRIWFLSEAGAKPIEIDRGQALGAGGAPTIAMDDIRIAWAAFDEPDGLAVSRLRVASIADLVSPTTLVEYPIDDGLVWFPTLNGDELWYAVIDPDFEGASGGDEFHLESRLLSDPSAPPTVFRGRGRDFDPAVNVAFVVWKTVEGDAAALNWGTLHVLDRRSQAVATIPVRNANRPTIGNRFIAFDEITHSRLLIVDAATEQLITLGSANAPTTWSVGGASLSGSLLTFYTQQDTAPPRIGWAILPQ